eukprot:1833055-Pleurochrysis_carterae.AAC.3
MATDPSEETGWMKLAAVEAGVHAALVALVLAPQLAVAFAADARRADSPLGLPTRESATHPRSFEASRAPWRARCLGAKRQRRRDSERPPRSDAR